MMLHSNKNLRFWHMPKDTALLMSVAICMNLFLIDTGTDVNQILPVRWETPSFVATFWK